MNKTPRLNNRKLKKEYDRGFTNGYNKYLKDFLDYKQKIIDILQITPQVANCINEGIGVDMTINISKEDLANILRSVKQ